MTREQRRWCLTAIGLGGDFVKSFAKTVLLADEVNEQILLPVLEQLMAKYPSYSEPAMQGKVI
jgi:hypothetical protein